MQSWACAEYISASLQDQGFVGSLVLLEKLTSVQVSPVSLLCLRLFPFGNSVYRSPGERKLTPGYQQKVQ